MKRIDLDQYEGYTEGPWEWDDLHSSGKEMLFVHKKHDDNDIIAHVSGHPFLGIIHGKLECANAKIIADAPELLQALKEAYDELDKLERALSIINNTHFPKE